MHDHFGQHVQRMNKKKKNWKVFTTLGLDSLSENKKRKKKTKKQKRCKKSRRSMDNNLFCTRN